MKPALVILAAGLGRRFGGLKQMEAVGPGGATIIDYSVFDAQRAGFGRVVVVLRPEMQATFEASVARHFGSCVPVCYACQRLTDLPRGFALPVGRTKPWGTGHAVLAAADVVTEPFGVINADDFYGARAFETLAAFLREGGRSEVPTFGLVGYTLRATLPDAGRVARAVCRCTDDGWLETIAEHTEIERTSGVVECLDDQGARRQLVGDELVSMNMWAFSPDVFDALRAAFASFLQAGDAVAGEFQLPTTIGALLRAGQARVKVLPCDDTWCGMTHPRDREHVGATIADLVARGVYPEHLWE